MFGTSRTSSACRAHGACRNWSGARARGRRRLDLGLRRRSPRRRSAVRPTGGARARGDDFAGEWSARRPPIHHVLFNAGALSLASPRGGAVFSAGFEGRLGDLVTVEPGSLPARRTSLSTPGPVASPSRSGRRAWLERLAGALRLARAALVVYGFVGGVIAIAYTASACSRWPSSPSRSPHAQDAGGVSRATRRSAQKLRQAAETIQTQNVSLEQANRLLKERSTAAMESLSATVDARDAYTAGHSRRVQELALAIGRELGLSQAELDLLGHAALFHDIGKLAIPDSVLLKPAILTDGRVVADAAPRRRGRPDHRPPGLPERRRAGDPAPPRALRRHRLPRRLAGEEIPLGARIIHVADALDSMLTTRIYRAARPARGGAVGAAPGGRDTVLPTLRGGA